MFAGWRKHELVSTGRTNTSKLVKEYDEESDGYTDVEDDAAHLIKSTCWICGGSDEREGNSKLKVLCWEDIGLWILRDPEKRGGRAMQVSQLLPEASVHTEPKGKLRTGCWVERAGTLTISRWNKPPLRFKYPNVLWIPRPVPVLLLGQLRGDAAFVLGNLKTRRHHAGTGTKTHDDGPLGDKVAEKHTAPGSRHRVLWGRTTQNLLESRVQERYLRPRGQFFSFQKMVPMAPIVYSSEGQEIGEQLWKETTAELSFAQVEPILKEIGI